MYYILFRFPVAIAQLGFHPGDLVIHEFAGMRCALLYLADAFVDRILGLSRRTFYKFAGLFHLLVDELAYLLTSFLAALRGIKI